MTDTMIRWDPLFPVTLTAVATVAVLSVLIVLELRRELKYKILRVLCQCLVVGSILLLTLRPSIAVKTDGTSFLLITDGATDAVIDSLKRSDPSLVELDTRRSPSLNGISGTNVSMIVGEGLPAWALNLLPKKEFTFIQSPVREGITALELPDHVYAHRWNEFRGIYNLTTETTTIRLRGPGGIEDSVQLKGPGEVPFSLSWFAKAPGRFNYDLVTSAAKETLPVLIEPERSLNILFVADYPTFESRYLKNFLASKGHRLSIRNQVSRGRYILEFANRPSMNFQTLTKSILDNADLLLINESSWHALGSHEKKNLRSAIQSGLGVILLPLARPNPASSSTQREGGATLRSELISFMPTRQKDTARVRLNREGSFVLPALPLEVKPSTALLTAADRVLSGYVHSGAGKIGYQLLHETYQLGLQEKPDAYSAVWVPLLEKCSRNVMQDFRLKITSPFPFYENQPVEFDVISSGEEPHVRSAGVDVPLAEDAYIDDLWHGRIWWEGVAWHDLTVDSVTLWTHVAGKDSWKAISGNNNRKATALSARKSSAQDTSQVRYDDRVLRITLFILFILASGFLWLAPKL